MSEMGGRYAATRRKGIFRRCTLALLVAVLWVCFFLFAVPAMVQQTRLSDVLIAETDLKTGGVLTAGTTLEQQFSVPYPAFSRLEICVATYQRDNPCNIEFALLDNSGNVLFDQVYNASTWEDNAYFTIDLGENIPSKGRIFTLKITSLDGKADLAPTIWLSQNADFSACPLKIDGELTDCAMTMKIVHVKPMHAVDYAFWALIVLLSFVAVFTVRNKALTLWKTGRRVLPYAAVLVAAFYAVYTTITINAEQIEPIFPHIQGVTLIVALVLLLLLAAVALIASGRRLSAEKLFLGLYIPISLTMMFVLPVSQVSDEWAHLVRCYLISQGQIVTSVSHSEDGSVLPPMAPENLYDDIITSDLTLAQLRDMKDEQLSKTLVPIHDFANTGIYPVNSYFPQAICMALTKLFTSNRLAVFYAGRFGAWLTSILFLYYAIKKTPTGKYLLIAVALLPIMLQEVVSASSDGMTLGVIAAFVAFCLNAIHTRKRFAARDYIALCFLAFCVVTFKVMYLLIALLVLALPAECYGTARKKRRVNASLLIGLTLCMAAWVWLCAIRYTGSGASEHASQVMPQLMNLLLSPYRAVQLFLNSLLAEADFYVVTFVGVKLSAYSIAIAPIVMYLMLFFLAYICVKEQPLIGEGYADVKRRLLHCSLLSIMVVFLFLLLWWSDPNSTLIEGVQGRYLVPLLFPLAFGLKRQITARQNMPFAIFAMAACDVYMMSQVLRFTLV